MHEAPVREMLDKFGARVLHPRSWQHGRILAGRLERCSGQARQEILRAHIGQEAVGADRIASDARNDATVRPVHAARQYVHQHGPSRLLYTLTLEGELAILVDQVGGMSCKARETIGIAGGDADILPGEGEHEQCKQHVVLDRSSSERFMQRIGTKIADHFHALARHLGARLRRLNRAVLRSGFVIARLLLGCNRHAVADGLHLALAIKIHCGVVRFAGLAIDAVGLGRQLRLAILVDFDDRPALG